MKKTFINWNSIKPLIRSIIIWVMVLSLLVSNTVPANTSSISNHTTEPVEKSDLEDTTFNNNAHSELQKNSELKTNLGTNYIESTTLLQNANNQALKCFYLGGSFPVDARSNKCDPNAPLSRTLTNSLELQEPLNPNTHVTYVCDGQDCPSLPVYYALSCSVDWRASDPYSFTPVINSGGNAIEHVQQKPCGSGKSGGCSVNLYGKINVSPNRTVSERIAIEGMLSGDFQWNCNLSWSLDPLPFEKFDLSGNQPKNGAGDQRECEFSECNDGQTAVGDPINPLNGNFDYSLVDLSLQTAAGPLTLQRSYASQANDTTQFPTDLGTGWTHNQDIRLIFGANIVWFKGHTVNQYLFTKSGTNTFEAYPGVTAELTYNNTTNQYTLTTKDKSKYIFAFIDSSYRLWKWRSALDHGFDYEYQGGKLYKVSEPVSLRFIQFDYSDGKLFKVADNTGRFVSYGYSGGNLTSFTDTRTKTWNYEYQGTGQRLSAIKEPSTSHKTILSVVYDIYGRAIEQYDGLGKLVVKIQYSPDGKPGTRLVTDALGRQTKYEYDDRNLLIAETDSAGYRVEKSYYSNLRLFQVKDQNQRTTTFEWSSDGENLTKITDAGGYSTILQYSDPYNPTHITQAQDPRGAIISYNYDGAKLTQVTRDRPDQNDLVTSYTYTTGNDNQPANLLQTVTNPATPTDRTITFIYDQKGQLITTRDAKERETTFSYDDFGRVTDVSDPLGKKTHYEYDPASNVTMVIRNYDSSKAKNESNEYNLTTEFGYDDQGRLYRVTDTLGYTTTYSYDDAGRVSRVTNTAGKFTSFLYNDAGQLTSVSDPLSHTTGYIYDTQTDEDPATNTGRLLSVKDHAGKVVERYTYYPDGSVHSVIRSTPVGDYVITYQYDALRRATSVTDNAGHSQTATYDAYGNLLTLTDAFGRVTKYEYNDLALLSAVTLNYKNEPTSTNEINVRTDYFYDPFGNLTKVLDANGHETTYAYNELNQLLSVTDPLLHVTEFGYDNAGNLVTKKDANNKVTSYQYDGVYRLESIDYPGGATPDVTFGYDALGRMVGMDDSLGHTTWNYDNLSRLTSITDPYNKVIGFGYDDDGKRTSITYPAPINKTLTYSYNSLDQLETVADGPTTLARYKYDSANQLSQIILGNGIVTGIAYDLSGQIKTLTHLKKNEQSLRFAYQYDAVGNVKRVEETAFTAPLQHLPLLMVPGTEAGATQSIAPLPEDSENPVENDGLYPYPAPGEGGVEDAIESTDNAYPAPTDETPDETSSLLDWLVGLITSFFQKTTPTVSAHSSYQDGYPAPGVTPTPALPGTNQLDPPVAPQTVIDYSYDALNRLTEAKYNNGQTTYSYSYDKVGNRISQSINGSVKSFDYDAANRLTNAGGVPFIWDDNGNLLSDGSYNYTYDYENRLIGAQSATDSYTFRYDGLGNRYQQTVNGASQTYAIDQAAGLSQVLYDGTNAYLYGIGRIAQQNSAGTDYFLTDALGSVRQLTNSTGQSTLDQSFDPFGNPISQVGRGTSNYGYAGEWTDGTDLQFLRARYYAPEQGRFLTQDPFNGFLSQPVTLHAYAYVANNPILNSDPSGLIAPFLAAAGVGGIIGAGADIVGQLSTMQPTSFEQAIRCLNWGQVGTAFVAGAVAGLTGFFIFGGVTAVLGTGFLANVAAGAITGIVSGQYAILTELILSGHVSQISGSMFRPQDMIMHGLLGGLFSSIAYVAQRAIPSIARVILQKITSSANRQLAANPHLARLYLSQPEYAAAQRSPGLAKLQYGNAVEEMVSVRIRDSRMLSSLYRHLGGPNNPDFVGKGLFSGLNFDITTNTARQISSHMSRSYGPGLLLIFYSRPSGFSVFP